MTRKLLPLVALASASCANPAPVALPAATPSPPASDWAAACADFDDWDKAGPPYRIHGSTFYVGTCGISAILVAGDKGHILIDGGTPKGGELIAANVERLGYRMRDVRILLHSHEHVDHVGGLATLQRLSGARLLASRAAAPVLARGQLGPDDPQAGLHPPFPAARVTGTLADGETVRLGRLALRAIATPGHTPGALSWQWRDCGAAGGDCRTIVYADSLNPISRDDYRFSDRPDYLAAFRAGLARVAALDCDILLTPHPSASGMRDRAAAGKGFATGTGCRDYAATVGKRLDDRIAREQARP